MRKLLSTNLRQAFIRISLVPVARFCLRQSIKLQEIQQALKEVLVTEAVKSLESKGIEISASKIALMTGVHRKDVSSIQSGDKEDSAPTDLLTKILGQWQVDRQFSRGGTPNPLTCVGKESEFVELVRKVSKEINPYSILFELERAGLVRKKDSSVIAYAKEFVPSGNAEKIFRMYEEDGADLLSAVEENATTARDKHFHLRTSFDNIPLEHLSEIHTWIFSEGEKFHKRARDKMSRYDRDTSKVRSTDERTARISVSLFEYSAEIKND